MPYDPNGPVNPNNFISAPNNNAPGRQWARFLPKTAPHLDVMDIIYALARGNPQQPGGITRIGANDAGPGLSGTMPPGHEAAMQQQAMAAQEQRATEMAAQARRSQLQALINPNLQTQPQQPPMEQQQGMKANPLDALNKLFDPNKLE